MHYLTIYYGHNTLVDRATLLFPPFVLYALDAIDVEQPERR